MYILDSIKFKNRLGVLISFVALIAGCFLSSCDKNDEPKPQPTAKDRTVLVYMVANNDLGQRGYDNKDIKEMVAAVQNGDLGNNNLIVYHSSSNNEVTLYEVTKDGLNPVKQYDNTVVSVSVNQMETVINDTKSLFPADKYGLVLWSHATGWLEDGIEESLVSPNSDVNVMSFGSEKGKKMNITSLATALNGKGFDFVYFDCCFMGCIEASYQLKNVARYIVASPTELPLDGMPYDLNVKCFFSKDKSLANNLIDAATNTFNHYNNLTGVSRTCTMAVYDTSQLDALAETTKKIFELKTEPSSEFSPQRFMTDSNCYLYDFSQYINELAKENEDLKNEFNSIMDKVVIYKASTDKLWNYLPITHYGGFATYIVNTPTDISTKNYVRLSWYNNVVSHKFD